jgi:hypothetical protein
MVLTLLFNRKEVQTKECKNNLSARVQVLMFACDVGLPAVASVTSRLNVTDCDETGFPHSFCEWLVALHLEQTCAKVQFGLGHPLEPLKLLQISCLLQVILFQGCRSIAREKG